MFDIIIFLGMLVVAFIGGWMMRGLRSIDYKKRWQEANRLLQQERVNTGGLQQLETGSAKNWKPRVVTKGIYTKVSVTDGNKVIPIKDIWVEEFYYTSRLDRAVNEAQNRAKQLNKVGAT